MVAPLEAVNVVSVNAEGAETRRYKLETMSPGKERRVDLPLPVTGKSYVSFKDANADSLSLDGLNVASRASSRARQTPRLT
ncbi:hypothetical protein M2428_001059 [Arthrobacter sp. ES3-54]|nr:hypothetical protein [Arthrobacter sp. ES3-54]